MLSKIVRNSSDVYKEKSAQLVVLQLVTLILCGERGILYHSTSFRNLLIVKCRL